MTGGILARFAVDPDALAEPGLDRLARWAEHKRFIELWSELGIVVHPGKDWRSSELGTAVDELDNADLKKLWQVALKNGLRTEPGPAGWRAMAEIRGRTDMDRIAESVDVVCASRVRYRTVAGGDDATGRLPSGEASPEIARFDCADQSETVQNVRGRRSCFIEQGASATHVWSDLIAPAARFCRKVVVVDRYSVEELYRSPTDSGLAKLVHHLHDQEVGDGGMRDVLVYAAYKAHSPGQLLRRLRDLETGLRRIGSVRQLVVRLIANQRFGRVAHDRYLRFGTTVISLGTGVDVLRCQGQGVGRRCRYQVEEHRAGQHVGIERQLERSRGVTVVTCSLGPVAESPTDPVASTGGAR